MSEDHDHDLATDIPTDAAEKIDEYGPEDPLEAVQSVVTGDVRELLSLLGGGALLLSALRSLGKGQLRAIPKAAAAVGLLGYGLRQRRSSEAETFQPTLDEIEGGTDGKETTDQAAAAGGFTGDRDIDENGGIPDSVQEDVEGERIEFTDDGDAEEPRTKPDDPGDEEDTQRDTDGDEVEIDLSDSAMAEEASEATGPDPEQAQPAQTDSIEPEETPEEDASDMKVEPGEEADSTGGDEGEETRADEDEDENEE